MNLQELTENVHLLLTRVGFRHCSFSHILWKEIQVFYLKLLAGPKILLLSFTTGGCTNVIFKVKKYN